MHSSIAFTASPPVARTFRVKPSLTSSRRATCCIVRAQLPVTTDYPTRVNLSNDVRKYFVSIGWETAWIDGIVGEIRRGGISTSLAECQAAVEYLTTLGIATHNLENMVFLDKAILTTSVEDLKAVVAHLESKGLSGAGLIALLASNPKLLTYKPNGDNLEKGKARVTVTKETRNGQEFYGATYWREGASFNSAPVAPKKP